MKEIKNRQNIALLVNTFYTKVRKDELLGPIFNSHIPEESWPEHLDKLTDFWVTNLLGEVCFKGNPSQAHARVDKNLNHSISQVHFGQWLKLWFNSIDSLYTGELADRAKNAARRMSTGQFMAIWRHRPKPS